MKPTKSCGISELLNMILDKGAILRADVIISLANVPLIGIKLHLAIAGIQTMLDYGMFEDFVSKNKTNNVSKTEQSK